jgi:putative ABC transport system permease protein
MPGATRGAMTELLEDVRAALRSLRHARGFAAFVVGSLALGIGASVTLFAVVDGVLLRPLPYPHPERLVAFRSEQSYPDANDFEDQVQAFESLGVYASWPADVRLGSEPEQVPAALVSGDLLRTLGVAPARGRLLTAADDQKGAAPVVVVTDGFAARAGAELGSTLSLSGRTFDVVGVMPRGFKLPAAEAQIFVPLRVGYPEAAEARVAHFMGSVARLRAGTSRGQAQAEVEAVARRLAELYPASNRDRPFPLISLGDKVSRPVRDALLVLFAAVTLLLLLACTNFANLLLARGAERTSELAVRAALGADRGRLTRQLLVESVLLAVAGGAVGFLLARAALPMVLSFAPESLPRTEDISLDARVLSFAFAVALLTGLLFGLVPALRSSRVDLHTALKERRSAGGPRPRLRQALVVTQVGLAAVLLAASGLLLRSLWALQSVGPGFNPAATLALRIDLPEARYGGVPLQTVFWDRFLEGLRTLPGVESAGFVSELPLAGSSLTHDVVVAHAPPPAEGAEPSAGARVVSPGYFEAMQIPLLRGRLPEASDVRGGLRVAVVNEALAKDLLAGVEPIGARIRYAREPADAWMTIVGVVGDVRHQRLDRPEIPTVYVSYPQNTNPWHRWGEVVIRFQGPSVAELGAQAKQRLWALDPLLPVTRVRTLGQVLSASLEQRRFELGTFAAFAGLALLLSAAGVYGVVAYTVSRRTWEMGVRKALGAQSGRVLRLVLGEAAVLLASGAVLGLIGALAAGKVLGSLLYGVTADDPLTFAGTALVLLQIGLLASAVPALRAARVEPLVALREE